MSCKLNLLKNDVYVFNYLELFLYLLDDIVKQLFIKISDDILSYFLKSFESTHVDNLMSNTTRPLICDETQP